MKKLALVALGATLAIASSGSVAKADFRFTQSRAAGPATDTVTLYLQVTNSGSTAGFPFVSGINVALLDYTNPAGLFVTTNAAGKVNAYSGSGTHFFDYITDGTSSLRPIQSTPNVVNSDGSITHSGASAGGPASYPYPANSTVGVQALALAIGDLTGAGIDMSAGPIPIGQAVVSHSDGVMFLQPSPQATDVRGNRTVFPDFQPDATEILVTDGTNMKIVAPTDSVIPALPEPAALGLIVLASSGLFARRRQATGDGTTHPLIKD